MFRLDQLVEILQFFGRMRNNSSLSWLPSGRTHFPVFFRVLRCLDQPQSFVHRTTDRQVIHGDLTQNSLRVDDEQSAQ